MKRTLLLAAAGMLALSSSYAQNSYPWPTGGNVGIGTSNPSSRLHISSSVGSFLSPTSQFTGDLIIQGNPLERAASTGASLEFVIPANTDGTNPWGQARILTVAGNTNNGDATGKLILGTRRLYAKGTGGVAWNYGDDLVIDGKGQVGIGTISPNATLQVTGTVLVGGANIDSRFPAGNDLSYLQNSGRMLIGWNRTAGGGETDFISNSGGGTPGGFGFYDYNNGATNQLMWIQGNGSVGIGTPATNGYKLAVKGSVIATSVKVELMDTWPDYVFEPAYKKLSLTELEQFVKTNKHLPEMPAAKSVKKDGIDLGDMNARLLKKVEELTLYLIEQNKQIEALKEKVNKL